MIHVDDITAIHFTIIVIGCLLWCFWWRIRRVEELAESLARQDVARRKLAQRVAEREVDP